MTIVQDFAKEHGMDPDLFAAFFAIESGPLPPVGEYGPVIRMELHHFLKRLNPLQRNLADLYFRHPEVQPWKDQMWRPCGMGGWYKLHGSGGQRQQHQAFNLARVIGGTESDAAYQAISMGKGQIMGFHHKALGYPTARAMYEDASEEVNQDRQFVGFLQQDAKLMEALKQGDMLTAIRIYNGPGQVKAYLAKYEQELAKIKASPT
jgi:hypothetical protein